MPLTTTTFKARFPEFSSADDALVAAKLAQATNSMDDVVWGDKFDDGQGQLAAHLLALSPQGQNAGLRMGAGANQRTVYQEQFERLEQLVGTSYRLVLP